MEKNTELYADGNSYTTEFRQYDTRIMRWRSLDPMKGKYPNMSPYVAFGNNPIFYTDPKGDDIVWGDEAGANIPTKADKAWIMKQLKLKRIFGSRKVRSMVKEIMHGQNDVYIAVIPSENLRE